MSADEFDPDIERLFARTPAMSDAALFTAQVEKRLETGSRVRFLALGLAGLAGGAVAVREALTVDVNLQGAEGFVAGQALNQGLRAIGAQAQAAVESVGLGGAELGSMGSMQMLWIVAGAVVALAAAGAMRLAQDV